MNEGSRPGKAHGLVALRSLFLTLFTLCCVATVPDSAHARVTATQQRLYAADESDFANPERGLSVRDDELTHQRSAQTSLAHAYVRLDLYRTAPLPRSVLASLQRRFDAARAAGVKLVPRFTYNFPSGLPLGPDDRDAALTIVLRHIAQVTPVLRRNADLIAYLEAGFIGAWGEWHHSTSGLDREREKSIILKHLLDAVGDRFVALRYERDKVTIFGRNSPATLTEILRRTDYGRVGHHDDCFLASADDGGTYRPNDAASIAKQKAYLSVENEHVPQGGETCNANADSEPYIHCTNALQQLRLLHWSQLNAEYNQDVLNIWRREGCYSEIAKHLGYRVRLISSQFPYRVSPGTELDGWLTVHNDGFAAPYNARVVELVLRRAGSRSAISIQLPIDPRIWSSGKDQRVHITARLPKVLSSGQYELLLNLPDPAPALRGRPQYSIRLANVGTWEPQTGFNRLLVAIRVTNRPKMPPGT